MKYKTILCLLIFLFITIKIQLAQELTNAMNQSDDPDFIFHQGLKELQNNNINNAIVELEKLMNRNTVNPNYYIYLGYLYYVQGDYDKAINVLHKSLSLNSSILINHILLGEIYYQMKNILQAREEFERVIELNPEVKLAHIRLYELFKDNNPEKANVHYLKIFQLPPTKLEKFLPDLETIGDIQLSLNKDFMALKDMKLDDKLNKNIVEKIFEENIQNTNQEKIIVTVKKDKFKINFNFFLNPFKNFDNEKFFIKFVEIVFIGAFLLIYNFYQKRSEKEFKKVVLTQYRMTTIKKE